MTGGSLRWVSSATWAAATSVARYSSSTTAVGLGAADRGGAGDESLGRARRQLPIDQTPHHSTIDGRSMTLGRAAAYFTETITQSMLGGPANCLVAVNGAVSPPLTLTTVSAELMTVADVVVKYTRMS